jgi:hypothetical protein
VRRLGEALLSDKEFMKKYEAYKKEWGVKEIKEYYPFRIVIANIFSSNSVVLARHGLQKDSDFLEKVSAVLHFPVNLADIVEKNKYFDDSGESLDGNYKLTYRKDAPNEPRIESDVHWLYEQCAPVRAFQDQLGDNRELRMFEALLYGDTESKIYAEAKAKFRPEWLKNINWDLVEIPESTPELDAEELERMARLGVDPKQKRGKFT